MIASARPIVRTSACHAVNRSRPRLERTRTSHQPHPERLTGGVPEDDEVADRDHHCGEREKRLGEPVGADAADHRRRRGRRRRRRPQSRRRPRTRRRRARRRGSPRRRTAVGASRTREARVEPARGLAYTAHDLVGETGGLRSSAQRAPPGLPARARAIASSPGSRARDRPSSATRGLPACSRACAPARRKRRARGRRAPRPDAGPAVAPAPPAAGWRAFDRLPA